MTLVIVRIFFVIIMPSSASAVSGMRKSVQYRPIGHYQNGQFLSYKYNSPCMMHVTNFISLPTMQVTSEMRGDEPMVSHHVHFSATYRRGMVVPVQFGAECKNGYLQPVSRLINLTPEKDICIERRTLNWRRRRCWRVIIQLNITRSVQVQLCMPKTTHVPNSRARKLDEVYFFVSETSFGFDINLWSCIPWRRLLERCFNCTVTSPFLAVWGDI